MSSSPISSSSSETAADPAAGDPLGELVPMADVICNLDFIIGTSELTVAECLQLGRHSVIRLSQPAGSDFDVRVHGVSIAYGEVAVVDDEAALRISRLTVPAGIGWE